MAWKRARRTELRRLPVECKVNLMRIDASMRSKFWPVVALLVYGAFYHLLAWRVLVARLYEGPGNPFTNHPLTNTAVTVLGGISVCVFMMHLVRMRQPESASVILSKATLRGLIATLAAFQAFLILIACYLAAYSMQGSWTSFPLMALLSFIDVETYGIVLLGLSIPFGLLCGAIAGAATILFLKVSPRNSRAAS
jgi:hypothetical protein